MTHIKLRRDTAANWAFSDPVLMEGELGWEKDTLKAKLGDGVRRWNLLPYAVTTPPPETQEGIVARVWTGTAWPERDTTAPVHWIDPDGNSTPPEEAQRGDLYSPAR